MVYTAATAEQIREYREQTGAGMVEAKKHFQAIQDARIKQEMVRLIESGTAEDVQKVVKYLIEKLL